MIFLARVLLIAALSWMSSPAWSEQLESQPPHPALPDATMPGNFGVNIHFTQALPGEMEMLAATGVKWIRMDWGWGRTERERGVYDFSEPDKLVAAMEKHRLRAIFVLSYGNKLYSPVSPATDQERAAFARWAVSAVTHFKGRGILWEMWNEPNLFWTPKTNAQDYVKLARVTGEAVRKAAPGEAFIGPAMARFDWTFLEACFKGGLLQYFDAVSVHPYRDTAPDTVVADYEKLRQLIAQYAPAGKTVPILSGEWGYSSAQGRLSEEQQARYLARQWLVNASQNIPLSIWYDWRDDGDDAKNSEHRYGLVRRAHRASKTPGFDAKPAYLAAQNLIRKLDGYHFERRYDTGSPDDWVLAFRRGDDFKIAAWTKSGEGRYVTLPLMGRFTVNDLLGQAQPPVAAHQDGLTIRLSPAVLYLTAASLSSRIAPQ